MGKVIATALAVPILSVLSWAGYDLNQIQQQVDTQEVQLGAFQPTSGKVYKLQNSITTSQATINLTSFKQPVSDIPYTMSVFNSDHFYATIEPRNPNKAEFVKVTGITQNSDGTATLTGVTRGLNWSNPSAGCTASTTLALSHGGQSEFILANSPCFQDEYAIKRNDEAITGAWTIGTPTAATGIANKDYVDQVVGESVSYDKLTVAGTAGETIYAGQVVYQKQSDGRWYKAGLSIAEASTTQIGIAQGAGTSGVAISGGVLVFGLDSSQIGLTAGRNYFMSATAGATSTATSSRILGRAKSTTELYVNTSQMVDGLLYNDQIFYGRNTYAGATTTFSGTATSSTVFTATSSVQVGAFPIYQIGKNKQIFTSGGTFTKPEGVSIVYVRVMGAGGGGGGVASESGGGGGAGAYAEGWVDISASSTITVQVGSGGAGGNSGDNDGTLGATSTFSSYIVAAGGRGGGKGTANGGGKGGTATGGDINVDGAYGTNGSNATGYGGSGGASPFGGGGVGGVQDAQDCIVPTTYGVGGGGGGRTGTSVGGCAGAPGIVIITW